MDLKAFSQRLDRVAQDFEERWKSKGYEPTVGPAIAAQVLQSAGLQELDAHGLLKWVLESRRDLPLNPTPNGFKIHSDPRFEIVAHLWTDDLSLPGPFDGWAALQVLGGSILQGTFEFEESKRISDRLRLGQSRFVSAEHLKPGDVVELYSSRSIYGYCSIESPSVTLTIRSKSSDGAPDLEMVRPHLAAATPPEAIENRLRALAWIAELSPPDWLDAMIEICAHQDLETVYYSLRAARESDLPIPDALLEAALQHHGQDFERVVASLDDITRYQLLRGARREYPDPELRYFLAALFLADHRDQVLQLLTSRFGAAKSPAAERARVGRFLVKLLIDGDGLPDGLQQALGDLCAGFDLDRAVAVVGADPEDVDDLRDFLQQVLGAMEESVVYRPLAVD